MQSGDGLLARVKPRGSRLSADDAMFLAEAAARWGNGVIELTSRANLQLRGFAADGARAFAVLAVQRDLAVADPAAERRRNVILGPMAEGGSLALARALEDMLVEDDTLDWLPAKFGLTVDAGDAPGDIRLRVSGERVHLATSTDNVDCPLREAVAATRNLLPPSPCGRGRGRGSAGGKSGPRKLLHPEPLPRPLPQGEGGRQDGVTLWPAFGHMRAVTLTGLADIARRHGDGTIRLTHTRAILLPGVGSIPRLPEGCIADPANPVLAISACVGRPGCANATVETRADAAYLAQAGITRRVHLSGCAKGCGRPPNVTTLIGEAGRYTLDGATLTIAEAARALQ